MLNKRRVFASVCSVWALAAAVGCTSSPPDVKGGVPGDLGKQSQADGTPPDTLKDCESNMQCTMMTVNGGEQHVLAMNNAGELWVWGRGVYGQLGLGDYADKSTPTRMPDTSVPLPVVAVSAGAESSIALAGPTASGGPWVYNWGYDYWYGDRATPNRVLASSGIPFTGAVAVSAGHYHALILDKDMQVWGIGDGYWAGTPLNAAYPQRVLAGESANTSLGTCKDGYLCDIIAIAAQGCHSNVALDKDGFVYGWASGVGGSQTNFNPELPTKVLSGESKQVGCGDYLCGITDIAVGGASGFPLAMALHKSGAVFAWGHPNLGQLGNGSTTESNWEPYRVKAPDYNVAANGITPLYGAYLKDIVAISSGSHASHVSAIDSRGYLWTWGFNGFGQLGNGTNINSSIPVRVMKNATDPLAGVWSVSGGGANSSTYYGFKVALTTDGKFWAWGDNYYGTHGDGTTTKTIPNVHSYPKETHFDYRPAGTTTMPSCVGGKCVDADWCYITGTDGVGQWVGLNEPNPDNYCEYCRSGDLYHWTLLNPGDTCLPAGAPGCTTSTCQTVSGKLQCEIASITGCLIDGEECVGVHAPNPDSALCSWCDGSPGKQEGWTARTGEDCTDPNDASCEERRCTDAGVCPSAPSLKDGFCHIQTECYDDTETNGPCQYCDPANPYDWTYRATTETCTPNGAPFCTVNHCAANGECGPREIPVGCLINGTACVDVGARQAGNECVGCAKDGDTSYTNLPSTFACLTSDGKECTGDVCSDGACSHPILTGCFINNACYKVGDTNSAPGMSCKVCAAGLNNDWSNHLEGTPCESDGLSYTDDRCDDTGTCQHNPTANCEIGGVSYAEYETDSGGCLWCRPFQPAGPEEWTKVPENHPCPDDGKQWTLNICDGEGTCIHPPNGTCYIDGETRDNGFVNPNNLCEHCDYLKDPTDWSLREAGTTCEDDGLPWTQNVCDDDGKCIHPPSTKCIIDGVPYNHGTVNEGNDCQWCDTGASGTSWSPKAKGAACAPDELTCTLDVCDGAGTCQHVLSEGCIIDDKCVSDRALDPENPCRECNALWATDEYSPVPNGELCSTEAVTDGACDGSTHCWALPVGKCVIGEDEYANGEVNPANDCERCNSLLNPEDWSPRAKGAACKDDGLSCTSNVCDGSGTCEPKLLFGCLIGDACVNP
ncbi:MAG: hypothetical protein FWD57_10470, partial [Polyangiaceae bacterium]|nr:hypothetical protein [Polyangiaceae bacterium]